MQIFKYIRISIKEKFECEYLFKAQNIRIYLNIRIFVLIPAFNKVLPDGSGMWAQHGDTSDIYISEMYLSQLGTMSSKLARSWVPQVLRVPTS